MRDDRAEKLSYATCFQTEQRGGEKLVATVKEGLETNGKVRNSKRKGALLIRTTHVDKKGQEASSQEPLLSGVTGSLLRRDRPRVQEKSWQRGKVKMQDTCPERRKATFSRG